MDKTRLALIGVGMIGKRHLKAMRDVEEAELAALVDQVQLAAGVLSEGAEEALRRLYAERRPSVHSSDWGSSPRIPSHAELPPSRCVTKDCCVESTMWSSCAPKLAHATSASATDAATSWNL